MPIFFMSIRRSRQLPRFALILQQKGWWQTYSALAKLVPNNEKSLIK